MTDFPTLLDIYLSRYSGKGSPLLLTEHELAELTLLAQQSGDAHPSNWVKFSRVLSKFTDLTKEGRRCNPSWAWSSTSPTSRMDQHGRLLNR